jgi:6-aminohexanoate-oligomer endohydrolase
MGLEAATGAAAELFDRRGHEHVDWNDVPLVAGAIIFDFGGRGNGVYPDKELGRAALRSARPGWFPMGRHGAATLANVGKGHLTEGSEPGGQGAALREVGDAKVAAFTVVNAMGAIHDRTGAVVRGHRQPDGTRLPLHELLSRGVATEDRPRGSTTLTLVVTNQRVAGRRLAQLAREVHASMARAIQAFHTEYDGDVLFFASTGDAQEPRLATPAALGAIAAEAAWDAVLASYDRTEQLGRLGASALAVACGDGEEGAQVLLDVERDLVEGDHAQHVAPVFRNGEPVDAEVRHLLGRLLQSRFRPDHRRVAHAGVVFGDAVPHLEALGVVAGGDAASHQVAVSDDACYVVVLVRDDQCAGAVLRHQLCCLLHRVCGADRDDGRAHYVFDFHRWLLLRGKCNR